MEGRQQVIRNRGIGILLLILLGLSACNSSDSDSDSSGYIIRPDDNSNPPPPDVTPPDINQLPVINSISLTPDPVYHNMSLAAVVDASDPDGSAVQITYSWKLNGTTISGETSDTLSSSHYDTGDSITLIANVSDGAASVQDSMTITVSAPPFQVDATPPATADYGANYSFTINTLDENNNPLSGETYELLYGPYGLNVESNGVVSWVPKMPMFTPSVNVSWGVRVTWNSITIDYEGQTEVLDAARQTPLSRSGIEVPYKANAMLIDDLDGNGVNEILIAGKEAHLYTLIHDSSNYKQNWYYPYEVAQKAKNFIGAISAYDLDGNGTKEVIVGSGDNSTEYNLTIIDMGDNKLQPTVSGSGQNIRAVEIADIDADGKLEIVSLISAGYNTQFISIRDAATLSIEWESAVIDWGGSLKVGEVDGTAGLEIITTMGYVYGYDGANYVNEWLYSAGFGNSIAIGDVNNSGVDEIVSDGIGEGLRVFSAVSKSLIVENSLSNIRNVALGNLDSDPEHEIVVADSSWGNVRVYSLTSTPVIALTEDKIVNNPDSGAAGLSVGDVDNDGKNEIVWGTGTGHTGEDFLVVAGVNASDSLVVEWNNVAPSQLDGPFVGGELATIQVGVKRLIYGTAETDSGYEGTRIIGLDPVSGEYTISSEQGTNWSSAFAMTTSDYDGDGIDEVFFSTASYYDGYGIVFDYASDASEWLTPANIVESRAVTHGRIGDDAHDDFLYLGSDGLMYIYDPFNSVQLWTGDIGVSGNDVEVADLDGDSVNEFITASNDVVAIYKKDASDYVLHLSFTAAGMQDYIKDIAVGDFNGDGKSNIAVLIQDYWNNGLLKIFDNNLNELSSWWAPMEVSGIVAEQLGSGKQNLVLSMAPDLNGVWTASSVLSVMDAMNGKEVMRSPYLPGLITKESVHYVDVNQDGIMEISYGTGRVMGLTR